MKLSTTSAKVVLGLFVVSQVLYMLGSNALGFLKDAGKLRPTLGLLRSDGDGALDAVYGALKHWGDLTGQPQGWSLFAPDVARSSRFPQLELRWEPLPDGQAAADVRAPVVLPPEGEPEDVARYFRPGGFRYRYWMRNLNVPLWEDEGEPEEAIAVRWQRSIRKKIMEDRDTFRVFMAWRWRKFHESHPDVPPPTQMILRMRRYDIPPPHQVPWGWKDAVVIPVARGRLDQGFAPDKIRIEMFDPVTRRFIALDH